MGFKPVSCCSCSLRRAFERSLLYPSEGGSESLLQDFGLIVHPPLVHGIRRVIGAFRVRDC